MIDSNHEILPYNLKFAHAVNSCALGCGGLEKTASGLWLSICDQLFRVDAPWQGAGSRTVVLVAKKSRVDERRDEYATAGHGLVLGAGSGSLAPLQGQGRPIDVGVRLKFQGAFPSIVAIGGCMCVANPTNKRTDQSRLSPSS